MKKTLFQHQAIIFLAIVFFLAFSFIQIVKHEFQFQTFGLDLGFYDQILWKAGRLNFSKSTVAEVVTQHIRLSFFENDFELTLLPLALLYRVIPSVWVLFVSQAFFAVSCVVALYFATFKKTASRFFSLALALAVFLSVPFQHVVFDGFTAEVIGAFFLSLFFLALFGKKDHLLWLAVFGMLLSKVEFSPVVALLGLGVFFFEGRRVLGIKIFLLGTVFFIFLVYFLNPLISPSYRNYSHYSLGYGAIGSNPQQVLQNALFRPQILLQAMITPSQKIFYLLQQLFSFAFLPLLGFQTGLVLIFEFFTRLANNVMVAKWPLHSFTISVTSAAASIYAAVNLKKVNPAILGIVLLFFAAVGNLFFHGPINSLFKQQFYRQPDWSRANHQLLALVPGNISVAANNSLVPHLSHRDKIYLLPEVADAQYILIDSRDWPNAFTPADRATVIALVNQLVADRQYRLVATIGDTALLKRQ